MVDGSGGLRPQWRSLLGVLAGLGHGVLAERARRLERVMEEEGVASLLPGSPPDPWRFDPIPLPLSHVGIRRARSRTGAARAAARCGAGRPLRAAATCWPMAPCRRRSSMPIRRSCGRAGTSQRRQPCCSSMPPTSSRTPDGTWNVAGGSHRACRWPRARAAEPPAPRPRRAGTVRLAAALPHRSVRRALHGHAAAVAPPARIRRALLTPGHADPAWYGHVLLARELSCALVEGGDLTVRDGGLFLKTLRGLQPIGVLLRGIAGDAVDPLELEPDGIGVPGLLAAARDHVRILNSPGSGLAEAPALAAFLPDLATRLLGEELALPSVPTVWLGNGAAREAVLRNPDGLEPAPGTDGGQPPVPLAAMAAAKRGALLAPDGSRAVALRGERGSDSPRSRHASTAMHWCRAPCWSACSWSATVAAGAPCRAGSAACCRTTRRPGRVAGPVLAKDVWVLAENPAAIEDRGRGEHAAAGDPPHRRRHAEPRGRQLLLARALPGAAGRCGAAAAHHHRPRQPAGADAARDGRTGGADRLPHPGGAAERRSDRGPRASRVSARRCCASPEAGARSTPCSARSRA